MHLHTTIVVLRLGAFAIGCATFAAGSYFGWAYSGWLLVPTVLAGVMCSSLGVWTDKDREDAAATLKTEATQSVKS